MPASQGNFQVVVNVPAASGGSTFVVNYTITCYPLGTCSPAGAGSFTTVLASGNQTITIPQAPGNLGFTEPSCNKITISGTVKCQTSPLAGTPFTLSVELNEDCKNYQLECVNPNGCSAFNTDTICPVCTELNSTPCPSDFQDDYWSEHYAINGVSAPVKNNKIPAGSKFNLCYKDLTKINQELGIGTPNSSWTITLRDELAPVPLNPDNPCCWECERRTFTFVAENLLKPNPNGTVPAYIPVAGFATGKYPAIHYTGCLEECKDIIPAIECFGTRTFVFTNPNLNGVTLCLRKGSYTVLNAIPAVDYIVSGPVTGRCSLPDQYIP